MPTTIKHTIAGADYSGLGIPRIIERVNGFTKDNLAGLYLFEDGVITTGTISNGSGGAGTNYVPTAIAAGKVAVGQVLSGSGVTAGTTVVAPLGGGVWQVSASQNVASTTITATPPKATDSSGNGNDGDFFSGSTYAKVASGISSGNAAGNGFLFDSHIPVDESFSFVLVDRQRYDVASGTFFELNWYPSGQGVGAMSAAHGLVNTDGGSLVLVHSAVASGAADKNQLFSNKTSSTSGWTGGPGQAVITSSGSHDTNFTAWAVSFDASTGTTLYKGAGSSQGPFTSADALTWFTNRNGETHIFGQGRYYQDNVCMGDLALVACYRGVAMDSAGLDGLITAAKTRVAARGVTVI